MMELGEGEIVRTAIFGEVALLEVFETEAAARAAGFVYDAHIAGGDWPFTDWKVLARSTDFVHREFCAARANVECRM